MSVKNELPYVYAQYKNGKVHLIETGYGYQDAKLLKSWTYCGRQIDDVRDWKELSEPNADECIVCHRARNRVLRMIKYARHKQEIKEWERD